VRPRLKLDLDVDIAMVVDLYRRPKKLLWPSASECPSYFYLSINRVYVSVLFMFFFYGCASPYQVVVVARKQCGTKEELANSRT